MGLALRTPEAAAAARAADSPNHVTSRSDLVRRALTLIDGGKHKHKKGERGCSICGVAYYRRDLMETWTVTRGQDNVLRYGKVQVRLCLECAGSERPQRFVKVIHDQKMRGMRI